MKIWKVWKLRKGKSFIHQCASDSDFFSHTHTHKRKKKEKRKKKKSDSNLRVNDMDKLHSKFGKFYFIIN